MTFALRSEPQLEGKRLAAFEAYIAASLALAWAHRYPEFRVNRDEYTEALAAMQRAQSRFVRILGCTRRWEHGGRTWEMTAYGVRPAAGE